MRRHAGDLHVSGLSADQTRSLAATLSAAAVAVQADAVRGTVLVSRARNRVFDTSQIENVIREWIEAHDGRKALLSLADYPPQTGTEAANSTRRRPVMKRAWSARSPR
jgi:hypothetical protein